VQPRRPDRRWLTADPGLPAKAERGKQQRAKDLLHVVLLFPDCSGRFDEEDHFVRF
jgi:hypothetical protein